MPFSSELLFQLAKLYMRESDRTRGDDSRHLHETAMTIYERACVVQREELAESGDYESWSRIRLRAKARKKA